MKRNGLVLAIGIAIGALFVSLNPLAPKPVEAEGCGCCGTPQAAEQVVTESDNLLAAAARCRRCGTKCRCGAICRCPK